MGEDSHLRCLSDPDVRCFFEVGPRNRFRMKKLLVVSKNTVFEHYSRSSDARIQAYMEADCPDVARMRKSHEVQAQTRERVLEVLEKNGFEVDAVSRDTFESVKGYDLVVSVGGDGTFLQISHWVRNIPMLGVTGDPGSSIGFFNTATADSFEEVIQTLDTRPRIRLHRMAISVNGDPVLQLALNDLFFADPNPAVVTRYRVKANGEVRYFKSSGFLVCTGAGSTAWMYQEGGEVMPIIDTRLQYLSRGVRGEKPGFAREVTLQSLTHLGRVFIDGVAVDREISVGDEITIRGGHPLTVIGDLAAKRR